MMILEVKKARSEIFAYQGSDCESPPPRSSPKATTVGEGFGDCDRDGSGADVRRLSLTIVGTEPTNSPVGIEIFAIAMGLESLWRIAQKIKIKL